MQLNSTEPKTNMSNQSINSVITALLEPVSFLQTVIRRN